MLPIVHLVEQIPDFVPRRSFLQHWEKAVYLFFVLVFAFAFLAYAWPTRSTYQHHEGKLVRIDRSTGEAELLTDSGWVWLGP